MKIISNSSKVPLPTNDGRKLSIFGVFKSLSELGHDIDLQLYKKYFDKVYYYFNTKLCLQK